jgi:hypothetical protein
MMTTVKEIEEAVLSLSPEALTEFRAWFTEFDANVWDQQIEADALSGRLDALASEALESLDAGQCTDR